MKKLEKLQINSEKLIKDEELITLRGGYGDCWWCWVTCPDGSLSGQCCGPSWTYVWETCEAMWDHDGCFCTISTSPY